MYNEYINNVLGNQDKQKQELTEKIDKMYNTSFYDDANSKYDFNQALKKIGLNNTSDTQANNIVQTNQYKPKIEKKSFYDFYNKELIDRLKTQHKKPNIQGYNKKEYEEYEPTDDNQEQTIVFNGNADENSLGNLDVTTELPKLSSSQIKDIITTYFPNSSVITAADAEGIYKAQQQSGMSALAILGIGALESGYGTSNIAKKKGNIWGWGATNNNPMGNAKTFSQMSKGALEFANSYLNTYYNNYGAKTINSAGTGNNPSKKGYAYNDDGTINTKWATDVTDIMKKFYQAAKKSSTSTTSNNQQNQQKTNNSSSLANKVGQKIADVSGYNNSAAKGQCVWFVRGRMKQKFGKETGALGNGNQMWYNAKESAKLAPTEANIKPDTIASYKTGLSAAGKKYGHAIYIEDVVGDTVYYTEGGAYYYNNGTIGTLKKASKKEILNGSSKFGYGLIGFIDAANY